MTIANNPRRHRASVRGVSLGEKFVRRARNIFENQLDNIAEVCNNSLMSEIRDAILREIERSNLTIYQVAKLVEGRVPQRTVYAFLRREEDSLTGTASIIMNALGLTITNKSNIKRSKRSRKEK